MRAAVLRQFNAPLSLESVPDPVCEPDGVVLKVLSCGICRSDWHGWVGEHPRVKPGAPRPMGLEPGANGNIWHLQRVEEKK